MPCFMQRAPPHRWASVWTVRARARGCVCGRKQSATPLHNTPLECAAHRGFGLGEVAQRGGGVVRLAQVADDAEALRERARPRGLQRGEAAHAAPSVPLAVAAPAVRAPALDLAGCAALRGCACEVAHLPPCMRRAALYLPLCMRFWANTSKNIPIESHSYRLSMSRPRQRAPQPQGEHYTHECTQSRARYVEHAAMGSTAADAT